MNSNDLECLANVLVNDAWWYDGSCTWITQKHGLRLGNRWYGTAGTSLYGGTSGVALALAIYGGVRDEAHYIDAAYGAIRNTERLLVESDKRGGMFDGSAGSAIAISHIGLVLDDEKIVDKARTMMAVCWQRVASDTDYAGGIAGELVATMWMYELEIAKSPLKWLEQSRTELIRRLNLQLPEQLGLAHGRAGIGLGLIASGVLLGQPSDTEWGYRLVRESAESALEDGGLPARQSAAWCSGLPGLLDVLRSVRVRGGRDDLLISRLKARILSDVATGGLWKDQTACHGITGAALSLGSAGVKEYDSPSGPSELGPYGRLQGLGVPPGRHCSRPI